MGCVVIENNLSDGSAGLNTVGTVCPMPIDPADVADALGRDGADPRASVRALERRCRSLGISGASTVLRAGITEYRRRRGMRTTPGPPDPVGWISAHEASRRLNLSYRRINQLMASGDLPPYRDSAYRAWIPIDAVNRLKTGDRIE